MNEMVHELTCDELGKTKIIVGVIGMENIRLFIKIIIMIAVR